MLQKCLTTTNVPKIADMLTFMAKNFPDITKELAKSDEFVDAAKQLSKADTSKLTKKETEAINEALEKAGLSEYAIKSVSGFSTIDYRKVFFDKHPELEGKVVVHHSIEQQVLKRYPGLFTKEEINAYEMLRGIPKEVNSDTHLSKIRVEWNNFYKKVDAGEIPLTKDSFYNKAKEIDDLK